MTTFNIIVAMDKNNGIGKDNEIPWFLPNDLKYFQTVTQHSDDKDKKNVVIMGRNTWLSLPKKIRPLKNRINLIITTHYIEDHNKAYCFSTLHDALNNINKMKNINEIFVIGGQRLYEEAIKREDCNKIYITHIENSYECDVYFPTIDGTVYKLDKESDENDKQIKYRYCVYCRK